MMKFKLLLLFVITGFLATAQEKNPVSDHFTIEGLVKKSVDVSLKDFASYTHYSLDSIVIKNHRLEYKSTLKNVRGVLLKDIFSKIEIESERPTVLSEFYFVCEAADGYKVVFSWNELFNTEIGRTVFIITESNGKPAAQSDNRIALISPNDYATGRRYVKGLQKIKVERVK